MNVIPVPGNGIMLGRVTGWPMRAVPAYIITAISRDFRRPLKNEFKLQHRINISLVDKHLVDRGAWSLIGVCASLCSTQHIIRGWLNRVGAPLDAEYELAAKNTCLSWSIE